MVVAVENNLDLRERRELLGLTLDEVAQALGGSSMDITAISRFERGFRPSLPNKKTRADYERVLDQLARERGAA